MTALAPFQIAVIAAAIFVLSAAGLILLETERRRRLLTRAISARECSRGASALAGISSPAGSCRRPAWRWSARKEVEQTEKALIAAGYRSKAALYQLLGLRTVGLFVGIGGSAGLVATGTSARSAGPAARLHRRNPARLASAHDGRGLYRQPPAQNPGRGSAQRHRSADHLRRGGSQHRGGC